MGINEQFQTIKNNWLLVVIVLALIVFFSGGTDMIKNQVSNSLMESVSYDAPMATKAMGSYRDNSGGDFAPETDVRKVTKTTSISEEITRGNFKDAETKLNNIISSSSSFLLNQNTNEYGSGASSYLQGYYQIKVDTKKYDSVLSQLKEIGKITSISESSDDITGTYQDQKQRLEAENKRLLRYQEMYKEAQNVNDKITLSDRIFDQERTIGYIEDSIKNMDLKIDYSTIYFTMTEKQSGYAGMALVKISALIKNFVESFNNLMNFIFVILPWAIALILIRFVWKLFKRRR